MGLIRLFWGRLVNGRAAREMVILGSVAHPPRCGSAIEVSTEASVPPETVRYWSQGHGWLRMSANPRFKGKLHAEPIGPVH